jgi:hypothetical protein
MLRMTIECHPERSEGSSYVIGKKYNFLYKNKVRWAMPILQKNELYQRSMCDGKI